MRSSERLPAAALRRRSALFSLLLVAARGVALAADGWSVQPVAEGALAIYETTIGLDPANAVHIAAYPTFPPGASPLYVTNASGGFHPEDIPTVRDLGASRALLAVGPDGTVLVLTGASDEFGFPLVDRRAGGTWTSDRWDGPGLTDMAYAADGVLHGVYATDCPGFEEDCGCGGDARVDIRHVALQGGSFVEETAVSQCGFSSWQEIKIAIGRDGAVHLAWLDAGSQSSAPVKVRHAVRTGGVWSTSEVAEVTNATAWSHPLDIAADSAGHPHVVYFSDQDPDLFVSYATNSGGGWETFRFAGRGAYPSVAVDTQDGVHVVYDDPFLNKNELLYARRTAGSDVSAWRRELIDRANADTVSDLAVDASGRVHVAFYEGNTRTLKYATRGASGGGSGPGVISPDTTVEQVSTKPVIQVRCVRLTTAGKDTCLAQGFTTTGGVAVQVATVDVAPLAEDGAAAQPVTRTAKKKFKKSQGMARFKLKLNPLGKRLLKQSPTGTLDVEVRLQLKSGGPASLLSRLIRVLRRS